MRGSRRRNRRLSRRRIAPSWRAWRSRNASFYFVCAFLVGLLCGAAIAYYLGYRDIVFTIFKWAISGTGIALILSILNFGKLYSFKCPRCDGNYFWGAPWGVFSKQCGTCGLPLYLPDVDLTP